MSEIPKPLLQLVRNDFDFHPFWLCSSAVAVQGYYGCSGRTKEEAYERYKRMHETGKYPKDNPVRQRELETLMIGEFPANDIPFHGGPNAR